MRKLIAYQTEDYPEELIRTEQENLNRLYDAYTAKYGLINSRGNYLAFASDESYFLLCSLEVLDDEGNFKRKADTVLQEDYQAPPCRDFRGNGKRSLLAIPSEKKPVWICRLWRS